MASIEDRKKSFEDKFAHDADMQFKAEARRNRILGQWAADLLGRDAAEYTKEIRRADFEEAGDEDVFRKLKADLDGHADEAAIRSKMDEAMTQAKADLAEGA